MNAGLRLMGYFSNGAYQSEPEKPNHLFSRNRQDYSSGYGLTTMATRQNLFSEQVLRQRGLWWS
jgi:hypothetical protein